MCQQLVKPNWAYVLGEFGILAIAEMVSEAKLRDDNVS